MLLYNITFIVDDNIKEDFLKTLSSEYIPNMQIYGILRNPKLHRIINNDNISENSTNYALQFNAESPEKLTDFLVKYADIITTEFLSKFENKVLAVVSVMIEENIN